MIVTEFTEDVSITTAVTYAHVTSVMQPLTPVVPVPVSADIFVFNILIVLVIIHFINSILTNIYVYLDLSRYVVIKQSEMLLRSIECWNILHPLTPLRYRYQ